MKGGKEEDGNNNEPLFPRLSINDRDIGGPRPPPRNKMALYEQLSIPSSQRFNSSTASPPQRGDILVTSSSNQGYWQHRTTFAPSDVPARSPVNLGKRVHPQFSDGLSLKSTRMEFGRSSKRQAPESSNAKKPCQNSIDNFDDNNDCMVPTFPPSTISEKIATKSRISAASGTENPQKSPSNLTSKNIERNHTEQKDPDSVSRSSNYENSVHAKYCSNGIEKEVRCFNAHDEASLGQNAHDEAAKLNCENEEKAAQSVDLGDAKRNEVREASLLDSISSVVISPDDVVGAIGPKHFWKARRAIVNQQRIFAIQVFELHRLIKVQKLIAASPEVLKVDIYLNPSPLEVPTEVMPPGILQKSSHASIIDESTEHPHESAARDLSASSDNTVNPWGFHPSMNQWLIPMMSPSEGLIYKPYSGLCPPGPGYMPPLYGNPAAPMSFPMLPLQYQQPPLYFPSSGPSNAPSMNSAFGFQKSEASRGGEPQGAAFAGPSERTRGGDLDSNGTNQGSEPSTGQDNQNRVIRVVPRNARLAMESAAWIFRSIQEERKQYDSCHVLI